MSQNSRRKHRVSARQAGARTETNSNKEENMSQLNVPRCGACGLAWRDPHPRTGPREQCGNCGALKYSGKPGLDEDTDVRRAAAMVELCLAGILPANIGEYLQMLGEEPINRDTIPSWAEAGASGWHGRETSPPGPGAGTNGS